MYLEAKAVGATYVTLYDGDMNEIKNCVAIDTETGKADVFIDPRAQESWPENFIVTHLGSFDGFFSAETQVKKPVRVIMKGSGVEVNSLPELAVAARFEGLGLRLDRTAERNKQIIENGFIRLWAELGMAMTGVS